ncbi:MAG: accessory factor UbiK family protein [Solirubrobacterales bacterium]
MQTQNPFFDDIARMAGGALGALSGFRAEVEQLIRQQMERFTAGMDMVPREEFEVVREMAATARTEQAALAERVAQLEARLAELTGGTAPAPAKAAKPKAARKAKTAPEAE